MAEVDRSALIRRYRAARRDRELAVLEGFHALKHALRFGAELVEAVAAAPDALEGLSAELAPDLAGTLARRTERVEPELIAELVPQAPRTGVVAIARRPPPDPAAALADPRPAPVVLLEDPRTMGNMGACVRVAAAADAAAVLTTGPNDPWHPDALRGAAGLHFALPVAAVAGYPSISRITRHTGGGDGPTDEDELAIGDRPLVAIDPEGEDLSATDIPQRSILAFGTERYGLSDDLLEHADARLCVPMRQGVSSLNLATSVAAVLFSGRWSEGQATERGSSR